MRGLSTHRAKRDKVNEKVIKAPNMAEFMKPKNMPFNGTRMIQGGFQIVENVPGGVPRA